MRLETERLVLRLPRLEDVDDLLAFAGDDEVMRPLGGEAGGRASAVELVELWLRRWESNGIGQFVVELDGHAVGRVGLLVWDARTWRLSTVAAAGEHAEIELGWALARSAVGARLRDRGGACGARLGPRRARDRADRLAHRPGQRPLAAGRREARRAARAAGRLRGGHRRRVGASGVSGPLRPLEGTLVVDVTSSLAGPTSTQLLAALGADVVKIEPPGGDHARAWGPPFWEGESAMFLASNAGKRSLALDLGDPRGLEALLRLADRADVLVQSLRPGAAEQRGFGPDCRPRTRTRGSSTARSARSARPAR